MVNNYLPEFTESKALDLATILKASQAISAELELNQLLRTLLDISIILSGANKGILLLQLEQQLQVVALVESGQEPQVFPPIAIESSQDRMITLINPNLVDRVTTSLEPLIIRDHQSDRPIQEANQEHQTILYIPLLRQDELIGILYLECNLQITSDRLETLNLICSQAAISIHNSHVHSKLTQKYQTLEQEFIEAKKYYFALIDISEQQSVLGENKLAQERQYQSEQDNRAILAAIPDLLLRVTLDGTCIDYISPRSSTVDFLPINQHLSEILPPDILEHELQRIQQARETGELQVWEQKLLRHGVECHEEIRLIPCGDEFLVIVRDITDRKLAEAEIRRGEAHITALFRALPDLIMRVDQDGTYLEFQATKNFKVIGNTGDYIGTKIHETLPPDLAQKRIEMIGLALRSGSIQFYEQDISVDGKIQTEEVRVVPYTDNEVLLLVRDISDRKRAEIDLKESEERYRILSEFSPVGIFRNDDNGICTYANAKTLELTGLTLEENLGDGWGKNLHPDDRIWMYKAWTNFVEQVSLGNDAEYCIEHRYLYPDDSIKWGFVQAVPERNPKGDVIGFIGSVSDISDRKQSELALQSLLEGTASFTGEEFFPELVKHIAIALNVSHVYLTQGHGKYLETLAWYADGEIQPNFAFKINTTPSEITIQKGIYACLGVKQLFPFDYDLIDMNVDNYLGVALSNEVGEKLGVLYVLNHQPLPNPERAEVILRIFAQRAIAEIERLQTLEYLQNLNDELEQRVQERTQKLQDQEQFLRSIYEGINNAIFVYDVDGSDFRQVGFNPVSESQNGFSTDAVKGKTVVEIFGIKQGVSICEDFNRCLTAGKAISYEEKRNFQGRDYYFVTTVNPIKDAQGNIYRLIGTVFDISDRKQAEKELSQARNFLEAIIENIPLSLFVKNGKEENFGEFLLWNKTCETMFGLTKEQAVGRSGYDFFPKEQSDFFREKDRSSFALAKIEDIPEEPIDTLTLGTRILHTIKVPIFDEHGDPDYLICISEDISDRKKAEIALIESEDKFRASFEQSSVGMAQANLNGQFIKLNQKFCNIVGYTDAELLNKSIVEITHSDDLALDSENVEKILAGEQSSFVMEKRYLHKDGHCIWVNLDVSLVKSLNGQSDNFFGVIQDISDRKRIEKELFENEVKFRRLVEDADHLVYIVSPEGNFTYLSPQVKTIFGYEVSEYMGKSFALLTHPEDLQKVIESNTKLFTTGQVQNNLEFRAKHQDGSWIWISCSNSPIKDEKGIVIGFQGVAQDISDRKQMEEDIANLYEEIWEANSNLEKANKKLEAYSNNLESLVYHRTNELKSAQTQIIAQEKLASLGTLTAGVAHELRNPLNFVKNYAEGSMELSQDLIDTLEPLMPSIDENTSKLIKILITDLHENSSAIQRHSDRAEKVINNMMQYTRNDNEKIVTESSDLNDLIDQSLKLASFSKRIIDTNFYLAIHTNYAANLAMVDIFPSSLGRAIINLVENACDAMRFKQTKLQTENPTLEYEPTLNISTRSIEELVEIRIKDNGCGIPPDIQSKILDPFFTTKPPGEGTGLGLSLTHDIIVNQHQGTLAIDSNFGEYTEITITLPYIKQLEKASDT